MAWPAHEIKRVVGLLLDQEGKAYAIGGKDKDGKWVTRGKPALNEARPESFDCSGLAHWGIGQGIDHLGERIILPHGCVAQIAVCRARVGAPRILDLGFADLHAQDQAPDHVVIKINDDEVIEAREKGPTAALSNRVIRRPIEKWEAQKGFLGWWEVPGIYE